VDDTGLVVTHDGDDKMRRGVAHPPSLGFLGGSSQNLQVVAVTLVLRDWRKGWVTIGERRVSAERLG